MWLARLTKPLRQPESNLNTPFFWTLLISQYQNTPIYNIRCGNGTQQSDNDKTCLRRQTCSNSSYRTHWILLIALNYLPIWPLTVDRWPLTIDHWLLPIDPWPLTLGCWPLTVDCWPLTTFARRKWKKYVTEYLPVMKKVVLLHAD